MSMYSLFLVSLKAGSVSCLKVNNSSVYLILSLTSLMISMKSYLCWLGLSLPHYKLREVGKDSFQLENYALMCSG